MVEAITTQTKTAEETEQEMIRHHQGDQMTRIFTAVLIAVLLATLLTPTVTHATVNPMFPHASWLYCATAYIAFTVSVWKDDPYGTFMSMAILAYQC
jgi:putative Ca2+/H+ antiporter (TMEM165/GDT1 family)